MIVVLIQQGVAEVVFKDLAGNEFTFTTSIVYGECYCLMIMNRYDFSFESSC